ncbi:B12-binding domain-containing radical SAM protein [Rhodoplanes sp. Z2-YC6860]|uniref:B12-binding domain-containing radical SAM protein n=1 Tax=Rhodoplanes sp. Z2-YC6860 TaxID=674703 RepID=UPI00078CE385|nr:radical SAM protein [Rhodoplanes sp. Z2-YC6860]AMN40345.1 radical SAM family protein [Rhodoplanes sp. Z2-YC6860]
MPSDHRSRAARRFQVALIKPSHYDDEGYVIQWFRSFVASNSLAVVYSLVEDSRRRNVLGADTPIDISVADEINTRIRIDRLIERFRAEGHFGLVFLVGVQSNQFPRAMDIARPLRAAGISVAIGGFHVSGCLAMLPRIQPDLQEAIDLGVTLYAGELEGRCDGLLADAARGALKPIYNHLNDLPSLQGAPTPVLPYDFLKRTYAKQTSFDAGRGCPYQCSFCTIINVQGRKSRGRDADDIERIVRENVAQGVNWFFVTDDNFARNKDWEAILDRLSALRREFTASGKIDIKLIIQVDTLCHKIPGFIEKAQAAGTARVFLGLESINPENLAAAKKRQNKITEYREMLRAWKRTGVITYAGYILGFPNDTPESIAEDIAIIQRELPLDILEFFCLTPLPGSEDHKVLFNKGVAMDADMNRYDVEHVVTAHPRMSRDAWEQTYARAWSSYYSREHIERLLRRAAATNTGISRLASMLFMFSSMVAIEKVHPLQSGIIRIKHRRDRRPAMPLEPVWLFYPRYAAESAIKMLQFARLWLWIDGLRRTIKKDPKRHTYVDTAIAPVEADDAAGLQLLTHSKAAQVAVEHARKIKELTTPAGRSFARAP